MVMIGPNGGACVEQKTLYSWKQKKRIGQSVPYESMHKVFTAVAKDKESLETVLDTILAFFEEDPTQHRDLAAKMVLLLTRRGKINPSQDRNLHQRAQYAYSEITGAVLPCY